jgi:hypothetical protein
MSALLRKRTYDHPSSETSVIQITDVENCVVNTAYSDNKS